MTTSNCDDDGDLTAQLRPECGSEPRNWAGALVGAVVGVAGLVLCRFGRSAEVWGELTESFGRLLRRCSTLGRGRFFRSTLDVARAGVLRGGGELIVICFSGSLAPEGQDVAEVWWRSEMVVVALYGGMQCGWRGHRPTVPASHSSETQRRWNETKDLVRKCKRGRGASSQWQVASHGKFGYKDLRSLSGAGVVYFK